MGSPGAGGGARTRTACTSSLPGSSTTARRTILRCPVGHHNEWQKAIPLKLKDGTSHASLALLAKAVGDTEVPEDRLVPVAQYLGSRGYHVTWNAEQKKVYATGG